MTIPALSLAVTACKSSNSSQLQSRLQPSLNDNPFQWLCQNDLRVNHCQSLDKSITLTAVYAGVQRSRAKYNSKMPVGFQITGSQEKNCLFIPATSYMKRDEPVNSPLHGEISGSCLNGVNADHASHLVLFGFDVSSPAAMKSQKTALAYIEMDINDRSVVVKATCTFEDHLFEDCNYK